MSVHTSVMLREVVDFFTDLPEGCLLVDATTGEGGHSEALLRARPDLRLECWDVDRDIQARARERLAGALDRIRFRSGWFDELFDEMEEEPGGILFDLGISMFHFRASGRGFSFRSGEPLDMRLSRQGPTAADLVNTLPEQELEDLIRTYGEERMAQRIARELIHHRPITTADQLALIIAQAVPRGYERGRIHPATRTFQALRIAVNDELGRLERALDKGFTRLKRGGKMAVITFHSLEDRIVKTRFKEWSRSCICPPEKARCECGGKPLASLAGRLMPTPEECESNPPSRSAILRLLVKLRHRRTDA